MADARRFDSATVQRALASGTPYVRRTATLAIGQVGGRALAGTLRTLMTDADTGVAANAAFALGLLRDSASVGALAEAAVRPGPEAREAAWALGEIGEPARRVITGTLGSGAGSGYSMSPDGPRSVDARAGLLIAATKLRPVPVDAIRRYAATSTAGGQPSVHGGPNSCSDEGAVEQFRSLDKFGRLDVAFPSSHDIVAVLSQNPGHSYSFRMRITRHEDVVVLVACPGHIGTE